MDQKVIDFFETIPDDILQGLSFSMPWQYNVSEDGYKDPDDFPITEDLGKSGDDKYTREKLQAECWKKYHKNPWINTSTRGLMGRLTGWGFETTSEIFEIQEAIEEIELDPRNRLYDFWPKYIGRTTIEGELFLVLTIHEDGFVEVDFLDPSLISDKGDDDTGIIFHPNKPTMPLFYNICSQTGVIKEQYPSIFIARYPELIQIAKKHDDYDRGLQQGARSRKGAFKKFGGYQKFIVAWNRGLVTKRAVSHLRTTLEWLNHYENLKKYEIDHKKSSGAYLWNFKFTDAKAFKLWISLTDEERKTTGILAKKTPGSTIITPPGLELDVVNPNLSSLSEQDTDILQMVASGVNEPSDVMTGTAKGTFASVTASRGPFSDRTSDEIAYFDRFQKYDFWGSIFFLKSAISDFPEFFEVREAVSFNDKQKPVFKMIKRKPERLVDISYPVSETINFEGRAKGLLGVKHGPIAETLGVSNSEVARKLGIGGYGRERLRKATEDEKFPKLVYNVDAESIQEVVEGEPKKSKSKPKE